MSRPIAVLRPEPGASETVARIAAAGLNALRFPLFEIRPLAWAAPVAARFDSLILTSANAPRAAGEGLARYAELPVLAVGRATAAAAEAAGLTVAHIGHQGASKLLAEARRLGFGSALHLGGRETSAPAAKPVVRSVAVYASEPLAIAPEALGALAGAVALLHSPRAARRLAGLIDAAGVARATLRLAALSPAIAAAAGEGWDAIAVAPSTGDDALILTARALAD